MSEHNIYPRYDYLYWGLSKISGKRLEFDSVTKEMLYKRLFSALKDQYTDQSSLDDTVVVIIGSMCGFAEYIVGLEKSKPERQQRRQERINSLATHMEGIIEQIKALDSPALGYAIYRGYDEISKDGDIPNPFEPGLDSILQAEITQDSKNIEILTKFALGMRKAVRDLPKHSLNTSGKDYSMYSQNVQLGPALALEDLFFRTGVKFTTSNSGLAAECLRAIYNLAGLDIDRVDYWLKRALDHPDSMKSFSEKMQKRAEE